MMSHPMKRRLRAPKPRRPYVTPRLVKVEVRLDEAVLSSCKSGFVGGPAGTCASGQTTCATDGS
jgi:hypothetical protein